MLVRVIDGDTIDVTIGNRPERVRLIGVDTPESVSRQTPDQCFGAEASAALEALLPKGTQLRLERDRQTRDRYGRLLAYVYRSDPGLIDSTNPVDDSSSPDRSELFVNRWLLEGGYADTAFFAPNTTYEASFIGTRDLARRQGLGLWSACNGPDQPVDSLGGPAPPEDSNR